MARRGPACRNPLQPASFESGGRDMCCRRRYRPALLPRRRERSRTSAASPVRRPMKRTLVSTTACATTCSATVPLKKDCGEPAHRRSRTVHSAKQSVLHKGWSVRISSNAGAGKGGTIEESAKGLNSTVAVFPLMIMLMLIIFMVQLQSFQKMFLVISVAPLGLIGVVAALLPTGTPMGFVAILGIIALSGMIIRNSVILIDQIDMDMAKGLHPWDAVIDATTH